MPHARMGLLMPVMGAFARREGYRQWDSTFSTYSISALRKTREARWGLVATGLMQVIGSHVVFFRKCRSLLHWARSVVGVGDGKLRLAAEASHVP